MAEEKTYTLSNEDLLKVAGGAGLEVGNTVQMCVCPYCLLPLVEGTITRDELRTIDPETGKAQRNYMRGFLCTECSYTATGPQELPYFKILEGGKIRPIY